MKRYLAEIGRQGGKIGGKARTALKRAAVIENLTKARAKRWPRRGGRA